MDGAAQPTCFQFDTAAYNATVHLPGTFQRSADKRTRSRWQMATPSRQLVSFTFAFFGIQDVFIDGTGFQLRVQLGRKPARSEPTSKTSLHERLVLLFRSISFFHKKHQPHTAVHRPCKTLSQQQPFFFSSVGCHISAFLSCNLSNLVIAKRKKNM